MAKRHCQALVPSIFGLSVIVAAFLALPPARAAADAKRGNELFQQYCSGCHGPEGRGGRKSGFMPRPKNLTMKGYTDLLPDEYKASVFVEGLSTPSAATVDKDGNVWVAISGNLFGGPDAELMEPPHVKVFDKNGKLIKKIGEGTFKTVMNELSYCAGNGKTYIPEYGERIWEIDGLNGEWKSMRWASAISRAWSSGPKAAASRMPWRFPTTA